MSACKFDGVHEISAFSKTLVEPDTEDLHGLHCLLITPQPQGRVWMHFIHLLEDPNLYFKYKPVLW